MKMLAERKKNSSWILNPRGTLWTSDENKYGQKLMEKMGWSKGKGLGRKEDGISEPITVKYKSDNKGLGFTGQEDAWISNQDQFNSLLSSLNEEYSTAEDYAHASSTKYQNLEEKSKNARKRVHYSKFVRMKDISKYKEEDLKCILGENVSQKNIAEGDDAKSQAVKNDPVNISEANTFTSSSTINDYFSKKIDYKKTGIKRRYQIYKLDENCEEITHDPIINGTTNEHSLETEDYMNGNGQSFNTVKSFNKIHRKKSLDQITDNSDFSNGAVSSELMEMNDSTRLHSNNFKILDDIRSLQKKRKKKQKIEFDGLTVSHQKYVTLEDKSSNNLEKVQVEEGSSENWKHKLKRKLKKKKHKHIDTEACSNYKLLSDEDNDNAFVQDHNGTLTSDQPAKKKVRFQKTPIIYLLSENFSSSSPISVHSKENCVTSELKGILKTLKSKSSFITNKVHKKRKKKKNKRAHLLDHDYINCTEESSFSNEEISAVDDYITENTAKEISLMNKECEANILNEQNSPKHNSSEISANLIDISSDSLDTCLGDDIVAKCKNNDEASSFLKVDSSDEEKLDEITEQNNTLNSEIVTDSSSLNQVKKISKRNNDSWVESQKLYKKMSYCKTMLEAIETHRVLSTTNLLSLKGYGNW